MPTLTNAARQEEWAKVMDEWSRKHAPCSIMKRDIREAVDAVDDWVEANRSSFNLALPVSARSNLTASQKAELLVFVVTRRFLDGA